MTIDYANGTGTSYIRQYAPSDLAQVEYLNPDDAILFTRHYDEAIASLPLPGASPREFTSSWQALYIYFVAWIAALVISYGPVFRGGRSQP